MVSLNYITLFPFPCLFWNFLSYLEYFTMRNFKTTYYLMNQVCCRPMHFKCHVSKKKKNRKEKRKCIRGVTWPTSEVGTSAIFTLPIKVTLKLKGLVTFSSRSTKQSWCNGRRYPKDFGSAPVWSALFLLSVEAKLSCENFYLGVTAPMWRRACKETTPPRMSSCLMKAIILDYDLGIGHSPRLHSVHPVHPVHAMKPWSCSKCMILSLLQE